MKMKRRTLLKGAGGIAVGLPFLDAMRPAQAARAAGKAKRLIVFFSANGSIPANWVPTGSETAFTLSEILSPLQAHRDKLTIIQNLSNEVSYRSPGSNPHDLGMGTMLTAAPLRLGPSGLGRAGHIVDGTVTNASIDQEIAKRLGSRALTLGVQSTSTILEPMVQKMSYRGPSDPVIPEDDPARAFATLFGDGMASQQQLMALRKRRGTVLDAVLGDFGRLMAQASADDRGKLDRHATSIRELEKQLDSLGAGMACHGVTPAAPNVSLTPRDCLQDGRPAKCVGDFPTIGKAQMDVLAMAMACDLTPVAGLQWSIAESPVVHTWAGVSGEHHLMSHDTARANDLTKINKWYAQQFAYLLDRLQAVSDGEGTTLLDGSLVLWTNEMAVGASHDRRGMNFLLAGLGNGAIRAGRYLQYKGEPHNQLWAALLNMFGFDVKVFGDPTYPGVLAGLI